ncbi:MAG: hypothetical protein J5548_08105 [Prevotella sp.]|nr:hypothetical protein [Prevotella sp.]
MEERRRLVEDYFPIRSQRVLASIIDMVGIDIVETCQQTLPDDEGYYNLQGQRVLHPSKGLYVHRGRKGVVK